MLGIIDRHAGITVRPQFEDEASYDYCVDFFQSNGPANRIRVADDQLRRSVERLQAKHKKKVNQIYDRAHLILRIRICFERKEYTGCFSVIRDYILKRWRVI